MIKKREYSDARPIEDGERLRIEDAVFEMLIAHIESWPAEMREAQIAALLEGGTGEHIAAMLGIKWPPV